MDKKWNVSDIINELNIENTNYSPIIEKDIDLTIHEIKTIIGDTAESNDIKNVVDEETIEQKIRRYSKKSNNSEGNTIENTKESKIELNNADYSLKHYLSLKQSRKKVVDDFSLTNNLTHSKFFTKAIDKIIDKDKIEKTNIIINEIELDDNDKISSKTIAKEDINAYKNIDNTLYDLNKFCNYKLISAIILFVFSLFTLFVSCSSGEVLLGSITIKPILYILINTMLSLLSCGLCYDYIINTIKNAQKKVFTSDTILSFITIFQLIYYLVMLFKPNNILTNDYIFYTPIVSLLLLVNIIGKRLNSTRVIRNYYTILSFKTPHIVTNIKSNFIIKNLKKGLHNNEEIFLKNYPVESLNKFLENSFTLDSSDFIITKYFYYIVAMLVAVFVATVAITKSITLGLCYTYGFLAIVYPIVTAIAVNLPFLKASTNLNVNDGVIEGFNGVEKYKDVKTVCIKSFDLFSDAVELKGIKVFSGKRLDEALIDIASVILKTNSILTNLFLDIINNKKSLLKQVDSIVYEDEMGISAWVDNKKVLIGNRQHMKLHSITIPADDFEKPFTSNSQSVVYLSTSGILTAVFIVELKADESVIALLQEIKASKIKIIIKCVDAMLTKEKIADLFNLKSEDFSVLPSFLHKQFSDEHLKKKYGNGLHCNNGSFNSYIKTIVTNKILGKIFAKARILFIGNMVLSLLIFILMLITSNLSILSVPIILVYNLFWLAITILIGLQTDK